MKSQEILWIAPREVCELMTIDECILAVEDAFRLYGEGKAVPPAVLSMHGPHGGFHIKAGLLDLDRRYFAAKVNANYPENIPRFGLPTIQGMILLCDAENGCPLAIMDSRDITSLRTGAATAVATKFLARPDSRIVTICGCGIQGRMQAKAVSRIRKIKNIFAYDKDQDVAFRFAQEVSRELGIPVQVVTELSAAVAQSDICVTCTPAAQPLLRASHVAAGTFIAAIGADNPEKQELDPTLMAKSKIVADLVEQCAVMGDLHHAIEAGAVRKDGVYAELGEIVSGKKKGRVTEDEIIVFDSTGMALQDAAAAARVYQKAQELGSGVRLSLTA